MRTYNREYPGSHVQPKLVAFHNLSENEICVLCVSLPCPSTEYSLCSLLVRTRVVCCGTTYSRWHFFNFICTMSYCIYLSIDFWIGIIWVIMFAIIFVWSCLRIFKQILKLDQLLVCSQWRCPVQYCWFLSTLINIFPISKTPIESWLRQYSNKCPSLKWHPMLHTLFNRCPLVHVHNEGVCIE
jgi:hypothetical protein